MLPASLGSSDAWNAMLYGETNQNTVSFMQNQLASARSMFNDAGQSFLRKAEAAFNLFNGSEAIDFARKTIAKVSNFYDAPRINECITLEQFQKSSVVMQRFIMAEPSIRKLYHQQRCDGYAETYVDMHPGKIGIDHYDWRVATNSMLQFQDDGGYVARQFPDEILEGDRRLTFGEKVAIATTFEFLAAYAEQRTDDPTSPVGGKF
jgi:hypothetical protein